MSAPATWLTLIPLLLCTAGMLWLLWRDAREERRYLTERRRFLCPNLRVKVEATLVRSETSQRVIGVKSCSALGDGDAVSCGKDCVPGFGPRRAQTA
jgi:hypothetical protein